MYQQAKKKLRWLDIGVSLFGVFMDQDEVKINIQPCLGGTSILLNLNIFIHLLWNYLG